MQYPRPVVTCENWGTWDSLGGFALKEGEIITVYFHDGSKAQQEIHIDRSYYQSNDMGNPITLPEDRAYIVVEYHETPARVYLNGLNCKRESV